MKQKHAGHGLNAESVWSITLRKHNLSSDPPSDLTWAYSGAHGGDLAEFCIRLLITAEVCRSLPQTGGAWVQFWSNSVF